MKYLFLFSALCLLSFSGTAQKTKNPKNKQQQSADAQTGSSTKRDILRSDEPLTWLGIDFTQVAFIGDASQYGGAGEVTNAQIRDKYIPAWNNLFLNEQKKYDVAKYLKRTEVGYSINAAAKMNNKKYPKNYFSDEPEDYQHLTEAQVRKLVKDYNFGNEKGTGVLFIVEGMSKGKAMASAWVAFIDMSTRTVLQTARIEGKAGGFGFRNFWAGSFLNILKNVSGEMR